jgi:hypothetical protein
VRSVLRVRHYACVPKKLIFTGSNGIFFFTIKGRWDRAKKVWELQYGEILSLGLENRIVKELKNGCIPETEK